MLTDFDLHLQQQFPFLKDKNLLIAISGGVDSVVAAHLLHQLDYNISLAHCNFNLRGADSNADEAFVKQLSQQLKINGHFTRFDTKAYCKENQTSTQIGARELRYQWFEALCHTHAYDYVITAHHLNDSLETFIINLSRGTGLEGLTGIPPVHKNIVRPLLIFTREQIVNYATVHKIDWREDKSNAETKYLRNNIRHNISPNLKELNPKFEAHFLKTISFLQDSQNFIEEEIIALKKKTLIIEKDVIKINIQSSEKLSEFKKYHIFKSFGFDKTQEINKFYQSQTGKVFYSNSHQLLINREEFIISIITKKDKAVYYIDENLNTDHLPFSFKIDQTKTTDNNFFIDRNKLIFPLIIRQKIDGDCFYPTGMIGKKKVSKFYKDLKLSALEKDKTWLLVNGDQNIIAIINHRVDRRFSVKNTESDYIYLSKKQ